MQAKVAATSWDRTAEQIHALMQQALIQENDAAQRSGEPTENDSAVRWLTPPTEESEAVPCLIIGAGPTGLSAGYHYGEGAVVLEKMRHPVGGAVQLKTTVLPSITPGTLCFRKILMSCNFMKCC